MGAEMQSFYKPAKGRKPMNRNKTFALLTALLFLLAMGTPVYATELKEGMTQGDFALWLVREAGAFRKLPPAAQGQDAIDFLVSLGVAPDAGWDVDDPVTKEFLASLLGDEEDVSALTFEEFVSKVRDFLRSRLSDRRLGVFRAGSSASASSPAA